MKLYIYTERILWAAFLLGIVANTFLPVSFLLIVLSGGLLTGYYYFFSILLLNGTRLKDVFQIAKTKSRGRILGSILQGFLYAWICAGIVFAFTRLPGPHAILLTGLIFLAMAQLVVAGKYRQGGDSFYKRIMWRNYFFIALSLLFLAMLFTPAAMRDVLMPVP